MLFCEGVLSRSRVSIGTLLIAGLAACSSGGGSPAPAAPATAPGTPNLTAAKTASVTFTMHWTSKASGSVRRKPTYVSPSAQSVSVSVNGAVGQYLNIPQTTLTIAAPAGVDTFAFTTYDEQNGQGNALGRADVTQTIVAGGQNTVSATLNGVVASLAVSIANGPYPAGTAAQAAIDVTAFDVDGNAITGPGDYSTPIHLSINDPDKSGTLSFVNAASNGTFSVQGPVASGPSATLSYSGGTLASGLPGANLATVVASATGAATVSGAFTPTPALYNIGGASNTSCNGSVAGPDGNMWATDVTNNTIDVYSVTAGLLKSYPIKTANASPMDIISAPDGNLWFTENGASAVGTISTSGNLVENSTNQYPNALTAYQQDPGYTPTIFVGAENHVDYGDEFGSFTPYANLTDDYSGNGIVAAPDGNLYYTGGGSLLHRVSASASSPQEQTLQLSSQSGILQDVIVGPDGNIWVDDNVYGFVYVVNPNSFTVVATYSGVARPTQMTVGQDGAVWIAGEDGTIGRFTRTGAVSVFNVSTAANAIATAPNGTLWIAATNTAQCVASFVY